MTIKLDKQEVKYLLIVLTACNDLEMSNTRLKEIHDKIKSQLEE